MNPFTYLIGVPWLAVIILRATVRGWWRDRRG